MLRLACLSFALLAAPACAAGGTPVPEPSNMALFALGVMGLIAGRYGLGRNRRDDD